MVIQPIYNTKPALIIVNSLLQKNPWAPPPRQAATTRPQSSPADSWTDCETERTLLFRRGWQEFWGRSRETGKLKLDLSSSADELSNTALCKNTAQHTQHTLTYFPVRFVSFQVLFSGYKYINVSCCWSVWDLFFFFLVFYSVIIWWTQFTDPCLLSDENRIFDQCQWFNIKCTNCFKCV